ncbi:MAG: SH3 domain-containing protein [Gemmataceae bacterium]
MRHVPAWGAAALVLLAARPSPAGPGRDVRYVQADQAEIRSGPSDSSEFYVTNRLGRGQAVEVVEERPGGWLAIRPPEGSFSYVNTRFLRHMVPDVPTHVVTLDGVKVPVYVGSEVVNKRPTVVGAWLEPGAQVVSRGRPIADEDGSWMPIEAPARERRYVKASTLAKTQADPATLVRAASSGATGSFGTSGLGPSSAPSANAHDVPEVAFQKAERAERDGNIPEAIRLYATVGAETAQSQPALSSMALERARYLQGGYQNYGAGVGGVPPPPAPVQVGAPVSPGSPRVTATPGVNRRETSSFTGQPPRINASRNGATSWVSYRGVLRRAGRIVEGQQTYALDDPVTLRPILYTTPSRELNFEPHLNRIVTLSGYSFWRGDLRNNYMTAVRLEVER